MLARLVGRRLCCPRTSAEPSSSAGASCPTAVVALPDRGLQGAPAAEGLGLGLGCGLGHAHGPLGLAVAFFRLCLARCRRCRCSLPSSSRGADRRAHRGDVAQQAVEVVAAPVVKDHYDGLKHLGRDVAGVAQRPEIPPGAVAVVELFLCGLEVEVRKALLQRVAALCFSSFRRVMLTGQDWRLQVR